MGPDNQRILEMSRAAAHKVKSYHLMAASDRPEFERRLAVVVGDIPKYCGKRWRDLMLEVICDQLNKPRGHKPGILDYLVRGLKDRGVPLDMAREDGERAVRLAAQAVASGHATFEEWEAAMQARRGIWSVAPGRQSHFFEQRILLTRDGRNDEDLS